MWALLYANKTSGNLIAEYDFNRYYLKRRTVFLSREQDVKTYGVNHVQFSWLALWYCLIRKTVVIKC